MTISSTQLRIDLQESEQWRRTLSVTVPAEVVRQERDRTVKRLAGQIKLPGFRKGKVPTSVVEKQYGPALQRETLDRVIGEAYRTALQDRALQPISEGEVEKVDYEPEQDLTFSISFDVRPAVELTQLGGFTVQRPLATVQDSDIDQVLAQLREQNAIWHPVEEPGQVEDGELASVQILRLGEGDEPEGESQAYQLVVGEGDAIPDVENAIMTLAPGESGDFTVRFPMDFPNAARRGEEQRLRITVQDRRTKELPELDDDFARSVGDFESMEKLRERIRTDLEQEATAQAEGVVRVRLLDAVAEANPFDVPRSMVERYVESLLGDTSNTHPESVEQTRERIRPEAEIGVKRLLLIDRVAELRELHATREEMETRLTEMAERSGITPAQARAQLQKNGRLDSVAREITDEKVVAFLRSQSEIQDES